MPGERAERKRSGRRDRGEVMPAGLEHSVEIERAELAHRGRRDVREEDPLVVALVRCRERPLGRERSSRQGIDTLGTLRREPAGYLSQSMLVVSQLVEEEALSVDFFTTQLFVGHAEALGCLFPSRLGLQELLDVRGCGRRGKIEQGVETGRVTAPVSLYRIR